MFTQVHLGSLGFTLVYFGLVSLSWGNFVSLRITRLNLGVYSGSLRFNLVQSGSIRFTRVHSDSLGFTRVHWNPLGSTRVHSDSPGFTQDHSCSFWFTRVNSGSISFTQVHLGSLGLTPVHLFLMLGFTWLHWGCLWYLFSILKSNSSKIFYRK